MYIKTMPALIVKENIFFCKPFFLNCPVNYFLNRNRIKNNSKWICFVLKLKIIKFIGHVLCKAGTKRKYFRIIIDWIISFRKRDLGSELHGYLFKHEFHQFLPIKKPN